VSQRWSGYARTERDVYHTPDWVTRTLLPFLRPVARIWEPAAGQGKMTEALHDAGYTVIATDIADGVDFLAEQDGRGAEAIVTNPPFNQARAFIERALTLMQPVRGQIAMLLRTDFDHAITRQHLFGGCPVFAKKLVLTKRIVWYERPNAAPSFNHAWYVWDWQHRGAPNLIYPCVDHSPARRRPRASASTPNPRAASAAASLPRPGRSAR
jgi:hypothetical protein